MNAEGSLKGKTTRKWFYNHAQNHSNHSCYELRHSSQASLSSIKPPDFHCLLYAFHDI